MKPILFNTEMVKAILDDRKTVTRRIMKPQPIIDDAIEYVSGGWDTGKFKSVKTREVWKPPCYVDDILYVRETWRVRNVFGDIARGDRTAEIEFMAGGETVCIPDFDYPPSYGAWKPSIHMPKEAARLFLRVKNVRVERLLTPFFADGAAVLALKKEGVVLPTECVECISNYGTPACVDACDDSECGILDDVRGNFSDIWNSTVKPADLALYGWNANPWVWVIEFERCDKPVEVNCNG